VTSIRDPSAPPAYTADDARTLGAQFEAIVSIAADAIICADDEQRITLFNRGAEAIFGYTAGEAIGRPLDLLLPARSVAPHREQVERFRRLPIVAKPMGDRAEIVGRRKDGSEFPAEASVSKVLVDGRWIYTAVLRDISARARLDRERAELLARERAARERAEIAEQRALRALRAREEVLGVVSHDLRNPLSAIGMCARALDEATTLESSAREAVHTINQATEWMQRMIHDLLDVASIEAGQLSVERREEDMVILLIRAAEMFQPLADERGIALVTEIPHHLPNVYLDAERILQVLSNLLGNAIKFVGGGGTVTLRATREPGGVRVSVIDDGPGIPPEELPHVFDRFWHARRPASGQGSGLGLTIAKGIIDAHRGRIWIESTVGEGTKVHVTLPVREG